MAAMAIEKAKLEAEREKHERWVRKLQKGNHDVSNLRAGFEGLFIDFICKFNSRVLLNIFMNATTKCFILILKDIIKKSAIKVCNQIQTHFVLKSILRCFANYCTRKWFVA